MLKKTVQITTLAILSVLVYILFTTSCANQGVGPSGGPKDTIPPTIENSLPLQHQTQFEGKEIEVTFNEYIVTDEISGKLIVSPPLAKKPVIRTKGKSLVLKIEEDFIPDRTYSFDFGDGIKDYNENNRIKDFRMVFSTGKQLDSLRISGYIYDAFSMIPMPDVLATLYSIDNDSVFLNMRPDFIARTDDKGFFLFDNLPPGSFKLYGLKDDDKNLFFSNFSEMIAFSDSLIRPEARFIEKIDTLITDKDTIISQGYTEYLPANVTLRLFTDDNYNQYMVSFKRETPEKSVLVFNEPLSDSVKIELVGSDSIKNWKSLEFSQRMDTLLVWIIDSTLIKKDTLFYKIQYLASDSANEMVLMTDTLRMVLSKSPVLKTKQVTVKTEERGNFFSFSTNLTSSGFDLNKKITLEASSPVHFYNQQLLELKKVVNDSTFLPVEYKISPVEGSKRKFLLDFTMRENTKYILSLDTAVIKSFSGIPNEGFVTRFTTQKKDAYGTFILTINGIEKPGIVQLVKNDKQESLVSEQACSPETPTVTFNYLKPEKYLVKFIDDANGNGKWDTGKLSEKRQPEPIYYFEKEIMAKSNWEMKETWTINQKSIMPKIVKKEPEEAKKNVPNK